MIKIGYIEITKEWINGIIVISHSGSFTGHNLNLLLAECLQDTKKVVLNLKEAVIYKCGFSEIARFHKENAKDVRLIVVVGQADKLAKKGKEMLLSQDITVDSVDAAIEILNREEAQAS